MRNREKGFTLVEMVVTIVLIGILGMALIPGLGMRYKQDMRRAAEQICCDFNTMKDQSRATGGTYTLTIDSTNKKYTISPVIIGEGSGRGGNDKDDINPNVTYNMKADGGVSVSEVKYQAGVIVDASGNIINELKLILTYDGDAKIKSDIIYNGVTGHYSITY